MAEAQQTSPSGWELEGVVSREAGRSAIYSAVVLGYLMLLPPQLSANVIGSAIPPYRFFLIAAGLFVLPRIFRGRLRLNWADIAILLATIWICLAMGLNSTGRQAFTASVAHIADIGLAYFFARVAFQNLRDLKVFLILMLPGLLLVGVIMVIEAFTSTHIIQGIFSQITGRPIVYGSTDRLGLMRAMGPFPHPILAGVFLISFLPLYWLGGFRAWPKILGTVAALCSVVTVSSATFLGMFAAFGLLGYNWLTTRVSNVTWSLFFVVVSLFVFAAELGTKSGTFGLFIRYASLNSISGYTRVLIWEHGSNNVAKNPWFGIGYADWERPVWLGASMDNYWLLVAVRFGLPASLLIGLATVLAIVYLMRRSMLSAPAERLCERGVAISVGVSALALISVALWLSAQVWFFVLLGIAVSLGTASKAGPPTRYRLQDSA